jgi:DNA-binding MarR family transcriptional regulator
LPKEIPLDPVQAILDLYPRIYFACHTRHVHDSETGTVLSRHQASILSHLDDVDPIKLTELAEHMGVTPSTMSLSAQRLERQGFIERVRDSSDRRVVNLRLTPAGVRVKDSQSVLDRERVAGVLAQLSSGDQAAAVAGLGLLADAALAFMKTTGAWANRWPRGESRAG